MKRFLVGVLLVMAACGSFGSDALDPTNVDPLAEAGALDSNMLDAAASEVLTPDIPLGASCDAALACDDFQASAFEGWQLYDEDQPSLGGGLLHSSLPTGGGSGENGVRIYRSLPTGKSMRIEVDVNLEKPSSYQNHNLQLLSISTPNTSTPRQYLGIYASMSDSDAATIQLTATQPPETRVASAKLPYGIQTHIAFDVHFGSGGATRFISPASTDAVRVAFETLPADAPTMTLGLARQNGPTDAANVTYDNFRVTEISNF